ncbi:STAS domain-containing protein [Methylococcus geothermalis]|uniref:Anti-sigma factor antagonist n=1 Tax=Methylococcus geothermalis TaxID=2681310 RepID=A0A858Q919_9GAMM|nr:STAS domain-containing protein [Methylococcus geothermalis]QJD30388.1 anti-sigma factor antagonist [Methylococcus geothermalis]
MLLKHRTQGNVDIAELSGRLVMADAAKARAELLAIVEKGTGRLVVDFRDVSFIDSSGLSVLIAAFKGIEARAGKMVLAGLSPEIQALMELTRLNEIFLVFADPEGAARYLASTE